MAKLMVVLTTISTKMIKQGKSKHWTKCHDTNTQNGEMSDAMYNIW